MKTTNALACLSVSVFCVSAAVAAPAYSIATLGLVGPEHTRDDGYKSSLLNPLLNALNESGQVSGYSYRYNGGSTTLGRSAWLYDGTATVDIGLTGPEHTRDDGYRDSRPDDLNEAGQVSGRSKRYNGSRRRVGRERLALRRHDDR